MIESFQGEDFEEETAETTLTGDTFRIQIILFSFIFYETCILTNLEKIRELIINTLQTFIIFVSPQLPT